MRLVPSLSPLSLPLHQVLHCAVGLGLAMGIVLASQPKTIAAEQIVLKYHMIERSVSIDDLTTFVETGETTAQLRRYFRLSGQDPEHLRQILSEEVEIDVVMLDRALDNAVGDIMLDEMGDFVHTPSEEANREAMRSALILSASDDDRVSLIEVLQNYPTSEIHVNGNRVHTAYRQIQNVANAVSGILESIGLP